MSIATCQPKRRLPSVSVGKLRRAVANGAPLPGAGARVVDIHLIRRIGRGSAPAHDPHLAIDVERSGLACRPRYAGNGADSIRHRVIDKRLCRIVITPAAIAAPPPV